MNESGHWQMSGSGPSSAFLWDNLGTADFSDTGRSISFSDQDSEYSSYQLNSNPYLNYDLESVPSTVGSSSNRSQVRASSSLATSIPRRLPGRTFNEHFQDPPAISSAIRLPCEFHRLTGCRSSFPADATTEWTEHVSEHLQWNFPEECWCWFCDSQKFFAADRSGDRSFNFSVRMEHIRDHIVEGEYSLQQRRRDYPLLKHLAKHGLIPRDVANRELSTAEGPSLPRSMSPHLPSNRDRQNNRDNRVLHDQAGEDRKQRREKKKEKKHRH